MALPWEEQRLCHNSAEVLGHKPGDIIDKNRQECAEALYLKNRPLTAKCSKNHQP